MSKLTMVQLLVGVAFAVLACCLTGCSKEKPKLRQNPISKVEAEIRSLAKDDKERAEGMCETLEGLVRVNFVDYPENKKRVMTNLKALLRDPDAYKGLDTLAGIVRDVTLEKLEATLTSLKPVVGVCNELFPGHAKKAAPSGAQAPAPQVDPAKRKLIKTIQEKAESMNVEFIKKHMFSPNGSKVSDSIDITIFYELDDNLTMQDLENMGKYLDLVERIAKTAKSIGKSSIERDFEQKVTLSGDDRIPADKLDAKDCLTQLTMSALEEIVKYLDAKKAAPAKK